MKKITFLLAVLITSLSFAQQGINYKALIKDGNGVILPSTQLTVQFTIWTGPLTGSFVFITHQETHTPTTDANEIIVINIGEGVADVNFGAFENIDWSEDIYLLET